MKKLMIALLLVAGFALFTSDAQAARRYRPYRSSMSSQNYSYSPSYSQMNQNSRPGFLGAFMEFERRKNAMIFGW